MSSEPKSDGDESVDDGEDVGAPSAQEVEERVEAEPVDREHVEGDGQDLMSFLSDGGIKKMLLDPEFQNPETGHKYSQADLVADVINVMRMDAKQVCLLHGIDVEVEKMSPERAAELLEDVAKDSGTAIIEVFQDIEDKRDHVFKQEMTDEQYEKYMSFKEDMLFSLQ